MSNSRSYRQHPDTPHPTETFVERNINPRAMCSMCLFVPFFFTWLFLRCVYFHSGGVASKEKKQHQAKQSKPRMNTQTLREPSPGPLVRVVSQASTMPQATESTRKPAQGDPQSNLKSTLKTPFTHRKPSPTTPQTVYSTDSVW